MLLPPSPNLATLDALRASHLYQQAKVALGLASLPQEALAAALEQNAGKGNAPVVLALLEAGTPPTPTALASALESQEPLALHTARLLFDAGARIQSFH